MNVSSIVGTVQTG